MPKKREKGEYKYCQNKEDFCLRKYSIKMLVIWFQYSNQNKAIGKFETSQISN